MPFRCGSVETNNGQVKLEWFCKLPNTLSILIRIVVSLSYVELALPEATGYASHPLCCKFLDPSQSGGFHDFVRQLACGVSVDKLKEGNGNAAPSLAAFKSWLGGLASVKTCEQTIEGPFTEFVFCCLERKRLVEGDSSF